MIMNNTVSNIVKETLCPDGVWQFSKTMHSIFKMLITRFPYRQVAETEERYPTTKNGMGAYLDKFFARHYFQVQDSLLDYMTSESFLEVVFNGCVSVLDIGSGPAVASLAIADMTACIVEILSESKRVNYKVNFDFALNDTSNICLGLGRELLFDYFSLIKRFCNIFLDKTFFLDRPFPQTVSQYKRIAKNLKPFDIIAFSYVIIPLDEQGVDINAEMTNLRNICSKDGQILVVQDKYNEDLVRQIGNNTDKRSATHTVYSEENNNSSYTYEYYRSLC
jgi:ribosomal protein RSM22 (predicted rRNA methylase)